MNAPDDAPRDAGGLTPQEATECRVLSRDGWRLVAASITGPSHVAAGGHREDCFAMNIVEGCALAVVCDGAGSAPRSAEGAIAFSASVLHELETLAERDGGNLSPDRFRAAIVEGVDVCRAALQADGLALADHHATLVAVAVTAAGTLVAHVGDGLAAVAADGDWPQAALSLPHNGEFTNETFFVTEAGWVDRLRCAAAPAVADGGAAVVLTDGAMPFVIGADQAGLEPAFMAPVSRYLRSADPAVAAQALAGTLDSAEARKISSDDKTLVWIGRET